MKKILAITGATGKKSGGYFAKVLCEHADEVKAMFDGGIRAIVRATSDTTAIDTGRLTFKKYVGSVDDINILKAAFIDVDTVVHIAGIHWSREVVEAAAFCQVRRLIVVHTTGVYSKYKQAGEEYRQIDEFIYKICQESGIVLTVLRPTMIYGNSSDMNVIKFIKMVDKLPLMPVVNGAHYELQPVNFQDLGIAYYQVLMNETTTAGRDFNLSGGEPIELREMLTVIGEKLGKQVKFINVPFNIAYSVAWLIFLLTIGKKDFREKIQRLCEPRVFSHYEATACFGYNPMSFQKGVTNEIMAYREKKQI